MLIANFEMNSVAGVLSDLCVSVVNEISFLCDLCCKPSVALVA